MFAYPANAQVDVPTGANVVVTFSDDVTASALACKIAGTTPSGGFCLVGPEGEVATTPTISTDGLTVSYTGMSLDQGASYAVYVGADLAPFAKNLTAGPLVHFTTRSTRPKSTPPTLVAVNGGDPANPESYRPMIESSTIELLFSEPLDARTVVMQAGYFELADSAGNAVTATILTDGIHVAIDPADDLTAGETYTVKVGKAVLDQGEQAATPATVMLTPRDARGSGALVTQVVRTRGSGDPGAASPRFGIAPNAMAVNATLIGSNSATFQPSKLALELGDATTLDGPIAFTIRKGARLSTTGLDVQMGGKIPAGLSTGDIFIELLTDGTGRMYRNPNQGSDQVPENLRAPLYADLTMDVAVYSVDATGNASLSQTVLGLQATGAVDATDGVLDIEQIAAMDLGLLGVTSAPINLDLELITDTKATVDADTTAPTLVSTYPALDETSMPVDQGVELIFSEPIDLALARTGGIRLESGATTIPSEIESHGAALVIRPLAYLARNTAYKVVFTQKADATDQPGYVADLAGNELAQTPGLTFTTEAINGTDNPMTVSSVHPGVACALTGATATSPGRCSGGMATDDLYHPFTLAADEPIEVAFTQPPNQASITLGTACNSGSVRVEILDMEGACMAAVPGTLYKRDHTIAFIPDTPWATDGTTYRLSLISGTNSSCDAGENCGITGAASYDPVAGMDGTDASGGPNLLIPFTAVAPTGATYMLAEASPYADLNGNGQLDSNEHTNTNNLAAMQIKSVSGDISQANFSGADCLPATPQTENCMYLSGAMSVEMQPVITSGCSLPDGTSVPACMPVTIPAETMYATSVSMNATADIAGFIPISISPSTETTIMRVREPAMGPITGYIFSDGAAPKMQVALDLYLDAPDMSILSSSHDLHSKPISLILEGPLTFQPDGRISIALSNTADVPIAINVHTSFIGISFGDGTLNIVLPANTMQLQLLSKPLRGALP